MEAFGPDGGCTRCPSVHVVVRVNELLLVLTSATWHQGISGFMVLP